MESTAEHVLLGVLLFLAALLYSSVGHAGASGYLAAMALLGVPADQMKPAALVMNLFVATIGVVRFTRAGCFCWRTFWPFALGAAPLAFVGGAVRLSSEAYRPLVGAVLCFAAWRLAWRFDPKDDEAAPPRPAVGVACGAAIGLLSGLTGTGGGIFLTPLLIFAGWASTRTAAGVSVAFILVTSAAGLVGQLRHTPSLPPMLPWWVALVVAASLLGSWLGAVRLPSAALRRALAVVLLIAAAKLAFR